MTSRARCGTSNAEHRTFRTQLRLFCLGLIIWASVARCFGEEIVISIPDQAMALIDRGTMLQRYRISSSKFGAGDQAGSYRTPIGTLFVSGKFGDGLAAGTVIKNRAPTGEVIPVDAPNRDAIVSRVIWLRGMESQNSATHERCIYIHGTPEERRIGQRVSFGCIRMRSRDIIALFERVHIGMHVTITLLSLDELIPATSSG
jgi:lipoprotein-anchoring transpeptidase ErfK/SrfK